MKGRGRTALALAAWLVLAPACASFDRASYGFGLPGASTPVEVRGLARLGALREAWVDVGDPPLLYYLPDTEACDAVLVKGADVRFRRAGLLGELTVGEQVCEPVGIASLAPFRSRQRSVDYRNGTRAPVRFQATRSEGAWLLRGDIPLTAGVGWVGGADTIAVVPDTPKCRAVAALGETFIVYRAGRDRPLELRGPEGDCAITGLIRPPGVGAR